MFLVALLLKSPIGPYALIWAIGLLVLSATVRLRWAMLYAGGSILTISAAALGLLAYYDGVEDAKGNFTVEGPEFFGVAFLMFGSAIYAGVILGLGCVIALLRRQMIARSADISEQY